MTGTLTFKAQFTINEVGEGFKSLKDALNHYDEVVVNLTGVERADVAAIQMLIAAKKEYERFGHKIIFKISDEVKNLSSSIGIQL